jgi:hypothetical protein
MPVKHHLSQSSNDPDVYRLLIPFYHSYDTLLTEDYTVQVTLPHGAKNIKVSGNMFLNCLGAYSIRC